MNGLKDLSRQSFGLSLIILCSAVFALAQQARGTLRGVITDELGAAIVGASVTITDASGVQKSTPPGLSAATEQTGSSSLAALAVQCL